MKLHRLFGALCAALLLFVAPAKATEQASYQAPTAGPMNMAAFVGTYLNPGMRALATCSWGTTAPANGPGAAVAPQQCWWDTSTTPYVLKWYIGGSWVAVASINASTHVFTIPGLIIGTDVQAYDADLSALAGLTSANNKCFYWTGSATAANYDCSSFGRSVANAADAAALRTLAGSVIGTNVQAWDADLDALAALSGTNTIYYRSGANTWSAVTIGGMLSFSGGTLNIGDAELTALAGLTSAADKIAYWTGSGTAANADFTSLARTLVANTGASGMRSTLGVVIGTDVQAFDAELAAIAGLTSANNKCFYFTGVGSAATYDCSSFGRSVANVADASALRTLAGTVIGTDVQAYDADLAAIAGLTSANNKCFYWTGSGTASNYDCSSYGRTWANLSNAAAATAALDAMVGDSGSGGTKGLVPAAGAGDAAAGKFLKADGTFAVPPGTGGGGSLTDGDRQNILLTAIYQSKSFAGYRRLINIFADGFKAGDGLGTGTTGGTLDTSGGKVTPATSMISAGTGTNIGDATSGGGLAVAFDGATNFATSSSANLAFKGSVTSIYVGKNYSAAPKTISKVVAYGTNNAGFVNTGGTDSVTLTIYGKNGGAPSNATDGTSLGASTFNQLLNESAGRTITSTNGALWDYVWLTMTSAAGSNTYIYTEIEFHTSGAFTLVTTAQTADASVSNGRVLIEFDNMASPTLNTDLTAEVSCNGGSNWASASLSSVSTNGQGGRKIVESVDQACTAGTSFQARIKTLNSKQIPLYGASLTVH
jgi:hypothetical protein